MNGWLIGLGSIITAIAAVVAVGLVSEAIDHQTLTRRVRNDDLPTVKTDWPGNAVDQNSRFMDERNPYLPKTLNLLKWKLGTNPYKEEKRNDSWKIDVRDPSEFL